MGPPAEAVSIALSTFALIALAELGDKSQLVCMTLAMRHRHLPILFGAAAAFVLLNTLAVLFGAGLAAWIPERITAAIVAVLFAAFGIHALRSETEVAAAELAPMSSHGIFLTTVLLLVVAEFGDKTQIAVAALAGTLAPAPVWTGATAALVVVSALGIWAGRTVLQRLPLIWLHRLGGGVFLVFAVIAAWHTLPEGMRG
jgi:Ca2+/H+ antiporter, TMEM165/GDT1 family